MLSSALFIVSHAFLDLFKLFCLFLVFLPAIKTVNCQPSTIRNTACQAILLMATEELNTQAAECILKKLINYIINHLEEEQAPPSLQNLNNNNFAHGFKAGYWEAYRQWGVEIEERLDEAFKERQAHGR